MEVIKAKSAGFCFGVKKAMETVYQQIETNKNKPIYTFGPLIHNEEVVKELKSKGVEVVDTVEELKKISASFLGESEQIPPMYSAVKVQGKKLYELAREGKTVERKARNVNIFSIEILKIDLPRVRMSVHCSKGTYIRTLCHDIGQQLGCGGCMEKLLRTKVGVFELQDTLKLSEIDELAKNGVVEEKIISVDELFEDYEKVWTTPEFDVVVHNGNRIGKRMLKEQLPANTERLRVYDSEGVFIGIYEYSKERRDFKPVKMFYENN